jgi:hypothetical protein
MPGGAKPRLSLPLERVRQLADSLDDLHHMRIAARDELLRLQVRVEAHPRDHALLLELGHVPARRNGIPGEMNGEGISLRRGIGSSGEMNALATLSLRAGIGSSGEMNALSSAPRPAEGFSGDVEFLCTFLRVPGGKAGGGRRLFLRSELMAQYTHGRRAETNVSSRRRIPPTSSS